MVDVKQQLADICDEIGRALDREDLHEARRLNARARVIARVAYGVPLIVAQPNGGRPR